MTTLVSLLVFPRTYLRTEKRHLHPSSRRKPGSSVCKMLGENGMTRCRCCEAPPAFAGMKRMMGFERKIDFEIGSDVSSPPILPASRVLALRPAWQIAAGIVLITSMVTACTPGAAEAPNTTSPPQVRTAIATAGDDTNELRLPARVEAGQRAQIYARATGIVQLRNVELGDRVRSGQVLARISAPEIDSSVREARATLAQAQADEALAQSNLRRAEPLAAQKLISQEQLSERRGAFESARAARTAAEARVASVTDRQGFQAVRAPFDGTITARNIERGDRVVGDAQGAATPLFELSTLDPLRVVVDVPQSAALQVQPGLEAEVVFADAGGEAATARVERVARSISPTSNGMRVELALANPGERIPAGMIGEVRMQLSNAAVTTKVPIAAVLQGAGGARVATIANGDRLAFREVKLGRNLGNEIEIVAGLDPGQTVVLSPNALLREGAIVTPVAAPPAATPGAAPSSPAPAGSAPRSGAAGR
jgi:RND family efflux transporter MFP subunit